ncbi:uncharacterized protein LOC130662503 isoform X2 [Hydractinia symbiolongicarpus]|uniref:uncharacterized protein LOC130662503 isoform X2 n=1 Tax=Hydractinia symbiolongicarpus TaxID=13093 RepID=UPI00254C0C45|nr:uncharacterized protein LOC130662503 isoform X2 [Hydractinia symbiolongicarpus]
MRKKARVAPLQKFTKEALEMVEKLRKSPRVEEIVELKDTAKKKWNLLKNTIRFKSNLRKQYEQLNFQLMTETLALKKHECSDCLLEQHDQHDEDGHDKYEKNGEWKRKNYTRASIEHKEKGKDLIKYFIKISRLEDTEERVIDFEYLENMLNTGVDINTVDKYGQSVLHEVARTWHTDVARFLLAHGSNVNHPDDYGRTPLHVACAVDYPEMVELLLLNGADINCRTYGEEQTPIHFAAKKDASAALKMLLQYGADINDEDYKKRTPLQALQALDQFYQTNRANRKQFFYLNYLVPPIEAKECHAKSPLEVAVEYKQFQLLLHPVFQRLIEVQWQRMGKWGIWFYGICNLLLSILWTVRLCTIPTDANKIYKGNNEIVGVFLEVLAVVSLFVLFGSEAREFYKAKKKNENYKQWREVELEKDLQYAHPRWPEERAYLEREMVSVLENTSSYIRDKWNYFDWLTYTLMGATVILQVCNVRLKTKEMNDSLRAVGSIMLIFLWLRMLKYARPFKTLGPFVVMLSHVTVDTLKIFHLSMHFFVPYIAAFWVIFGMYNVEGYTTKEGELVYNIFQIMVVGDFNFNKLKSHSNKMAMLLCGTFIFFAGIICLNLFIALMSDTFQRVYDNAKANAVMERAASIIALEADINTRILRRHRKWVSRKCAPESLYYDDDITQPESHDLKRMTIQIKEGLDGVNHFLDQKFGKIEDDEPNDHHPGNSENQFAQVNAKKEKRVIRNVSNSSEVRELTKTMKIFKTEYYKSMIQTRAEIAGLGLMLKEIIEQNAAKKEWREKKRNYAMLSELNKSIENKKNRQEFLLFHQQSDTLDIREESPHAQEENISQENTSQSTPLNEESIGLLDLRGTHDSQENISNNFHAENYHTENNLSSIEDRLQPETNILVSATNDEVGIPNEGFFEGYTYKDTSNSDDQLIKATWNSIFSKIVTQQKNENGESTSQKPEPGVYVMHSTLSTIESSDDGSDDEGEN